MYILPIEQIGGESVSDRNIGVVAPSCKSNIRQFGSSRGLRLLIALLFLVRLLRLLLFWLLVHSLLKRHNSCFLHMLHLLHL